MVLLLWTLQQLRQSSCPVLWRPLPRGPPPHALPARACPPARSSRRRGTRRCSTTRSAATSPAPPTQARAGCRLLLLPLWPALAAGKLLFLPVPPWTGCRLWSAPNGVPNSPSCPALLPLLLEITALASPPSRLPAELLRDEGADLPHRTKAGNVELPGAGES